jgi:hypothetical protein
VTKGQEEKGTSSDTGKGAAEAFAISQYECTFSEVPRGLINEGPLNYVNLKLFKLN